MEIKKIFIKRLSEITLGMKQKEIAKIMGCTEGTVSKYLNLNKKDFPTVEMLYNIAQHFSVSIDWLVGNSSIPKYNEEFSTRDICKILLNIYNNPRTNLLIGNISVTEECYTLIEGHGVDHATNNNIYPTLYFSEWLRIDDLDENDFAMIQQIGSDIPQMKYINTFLSRLKEISDMKTRGNLNQEMYDRLLESYLNDVPDK